MASPITSQNLSGLPQPTNWPTEKDFPPTQAHPIFSWKAEPEPTLVSGYKLADFEKGNRTLEEMGKELTLKHWSVKHDDVAMSANAAQPSTEPDLAKLTDPTNLANPQDQLRQLRELEVKHESSGDFTAAQWKALGAKYKALTKLTDAPGTAWTRDTIYNGFWAKGAQKAILEGQGLGREVLDQAAGIAAESGAGEVGVAIGAAATKAVVKVGAIRGVTGAAKAATAPKTNAVNHSVEAISLTKAKFGHTFEKHGQNATEFLTKRAVGTGKPVGQFLDDQAAARLIQEHIGKLGNGAISVPVGKDFPARVIMPDGSYKPASTVRIVPSGNGVKTAYPEP
jgi:hypothetical protein